MRRADDRLFFLFRLSVMPGIAHRATPQLQENPNHRYSVPGALCSPGTVIQSDFIPEANSEPAMVASRSSSDIIRQTYIEKNIIGIHVDFSRIGIQHTYEAP